MKLFPASTTGERKVCLAETRAQLRPLGLTRGLGNLPTMTLVLKTLLGERELNLELDRSR